LSFAGTLPEHAELDLTTDKLPSLEDPAPVPATTFTQAVDKDRVLDDMITEMVDADLSRLQGSRA